MNEIKWYFPEDLNDVPELIAQDNVFPHSGGTGLIRSGLKNVKGLVDINPLKINSIRMDNGRITIGAGCTYSEVLDGMQAAGPDHILCRALKYAASTPLRNRITVGGSVSMFPYWSDLMGPLIALDSEVTLIGETCGSFPITEYVKNKDLGKKTLITSIMWQSAGWKSYYHRQTRTRVDPPLFTLTILVKTSRDPLKKIEDIRIVVVGCKGRFKRFDKKFDQLEGCAAAVGRDIVFPDRKGFSSEYLRHLAGVHLERGLEQILAEI